MATTDLTFEERLAALEAKQLALADLPLAALQRKLENDWQPDGAVLIQPHSITSDQLAAGVALLLATTGTDRKAAFGSSTLTWAAGQSSAVQTVTHNLGASPAVIFTQLDEIGSGRTDIAANGVGNRNTTTFQVVGWAAGGAFTGTLGFSWLAIA